MARDQASLALSRSGPSNAGHLVCCWDELWKRILAESVDARSPALASPIAVRTVFREASRVAAERDEIGDLRAMLEMPGHRRQLLARFGGWMLSEMLPESVPALPTAIDRQAWTLYQHYRGLLAELNLEDEAGLSVWSSKSLIRMRPAFFARFRRITFLDFEPSSPAHWRALEHAVQNAAAVHATLAHEPDPDRAEVYEAVGRTRERLLSLGFAEARVECDLWRPGGLRAIESLLFREAGETGPRKPAPISTVTGLAVRGAPQGDGSARVIAREVRGILDRGTDPDDIMILFRHWSPQAELVLDTLRSWEIPAHAESRRMLDGDPAVTALLLAMRIPAENWECDILVRLLRHGLVRPTYAGADPPLLATAASAIETARVFRGSPESILLALARAANDPGSNTTRRDRAQSSRDLVGWILGILATADRRRGWFGHLEQLLELAEALGLNRSSRARHSLEQLRDVLEERGDVVARLHHGQAERPISWAEFTREVGRIVAETALEISGESASRGIRLATVDEARGARARFVLLADLAEGSFPSRDAVEPFLSIRPGQAPDASARLGFSREALRFLGVIGSADQGLVLLYPTTDPKGQEILRAGFLDDLLALLSPEADRACHESVARFHPAFLDQPDLVHTPADRRVLALASARERGDGTGLATLRATPEERHAVDGVLAALVLMKRRGYRSPFSEFDGLLRDGAAILDVGDRFNHEFLFSPSQLETYIGCPFQFFAKYVMKLDVKDDRDELAEDFTERGSRIHDLLERLEGYRRSLAPQMEAEQIERIALKEILNVEIADASLVDLGLRAIEDRRLERVLNRYKVQLRDYEAGSPVKPIPRDFEVVFGSEPDENMEEIPYPPLEIGHGERRVKLRGMIDRIDVVDSGFRVIDYKSGMGPTATDVKSGHMLQLPLYALAVERYILAGEGKELLDVGYWGLKKEGYRSIRFEKWQADQEALTSYVLEIVQKLRDGVFPVNSRQQGCEGFCDFRAICRVRQIRSAQKEPGDAIVPAISLSASASRGKGKSSRPPASDTPEVPGVVRVEPLTPDPSTEGRR